MFIEFPPLFTRFLVCAAMVTTIGCVSEAAPPDPIIGAWESAERIGSDLNEMEIDADLEGEATVYFYIGGDSYFADFDVVAEPEGNGDYELDFECEGDCGELDFTADCELDGDELECEGDGPWEEYEFVWEVE